MTRFSRLHPYPAMVADCLAAELSRRYVRTGDRVLDPFCGTGRTLLAAAERGGHCLGVDVNPLAVIVSTAKAHRYSLDRLLAFRDKFKRRVQRRRSSSVLDFESGRRVSWFSAKARRELTDIIALLNAEPCTHAELYLFASILSATARDVSFCRKDQWKIHRMAAASRAVFRKSAWTVFESRLDYVVDEVRRLPPLQGTCRFLRESSTALPTRMSRHYEGNFDVAITSPPYGDSQTTVQYGGISSLCLGVLRHLNRLNVAPMSSSEIDNRCLGGTNVKRGCRDFDLKRYWCGVQGSGDSAITNFLDDVKVSCHATIKMLKPKATAVFVVARRRVAGHPLKLDRFLIDTMLQASWHVATVQTRQIVGKMTPYLIDSRGHGARGAASHTPTMRREYVLVFTGRHAAESRERQRKETLRDRRSAQQT